MKCMNVMQMQTLMKNIFGHERLKELAQGPCQTDSLRQVFCISTLLDANLELGFLVELTLI